MKTPDPNGLELGRVVFLDTLLKPIYLKGQG